MSDMPFTNHKVKISDYLVESSVSMSTISWRSSTDKHRGQDLMPGPASLELLCLPHRGVLHNATYNTRNTTASRQHVSDALSYYVS
jgi:hypothetical protein